MSDNHSGNPSGNCQFFMDGLLEIVGQAGLSAILKMTERKGDLKSGSICYSELNRITLALASVYGQRGGMGIALRSGRASLKYFLRSHGQKLGLTGIEFRMKPSRKRFRDGLMRIIQTYHDEFGVAVDLQDDGESWIWKASHCSECQDQRSAEPLCHFTQGLLQEFLSWCGGNKFYSVTEINCCAQGGTQCQYRIDPRPID